MTGGPRRRQGAASLTAVLVLLLALTGCQVEIYSGLQEDEANRMLVVLLARDFDAAKLDKGKAGFALSVERRQMAAALELLSANGLPRTRHVSLGGVFTGQGMISTPIEEQARMAYALSQELSETFSRLDGVLTARVHVVLAARDQTGALSTPATAAVFLRHLPDSPAVNLTPKIKEITSKSVPGLSEDAVSVMLVPVRLDVYLPVEASGRGHWGRLAGAAAAAALLVALGVVSWRRRTRAVKDG
jgi:type III secretion protein J